MTSEKKRRPKGEGGLYQRPDGRWEGSLTVGYMDGKRRRRQVVARTQADALARLRALRQDIEGGLSLDAAKSTVAEVLDRWLSYQEGRVRPRTHLGYTQIVRQHLAPALGHHRLRGLTVSHVEGYLKTKAKPTSDRRGLSAKTLVHHRTVLRTALRHAERDGLIGRNVAALAAPPRLPHREAQPLNVDEVKKVLKVVSGHDREPLYLLAMATGMRRGELLGLTWSCVDLEAETVRVERTLLRYSGAYHWSEPKTDLSRRLIAIPTVVVKALQSHRAHQNEQRLRLGRLWRGDEWDGLVFTNEQGDPLPDSKPTREFQSLLKQAGVRRVRLHDLRHGAATLMLASGVPMKAVQQMLGHSTYQTTANIYSHVTPEMQRDASDRLGAVLFGS